jgi:hypothetical protein
VAFVGGLIGLVAFGPVGKEIFYPPAFQFGVGIVGGLAVAAGVWLCFRPPGETIVVDRAKQTLTLTRRGLFWRIVEDFPGPAVADVRVTKERDGESNPDYQVEMVLSTGRVVPLFPLYRQDRERCMRVAQHLWSALGFPRT